MCRQDNYLMLKGDIDVSYGKLLRQQKRYKPAIEYLECAANNYKKQNFLTRMVNCFRIESDVAEQAGDLKLSLDMRQAMADTEQRRQAEELQMMDRIQPLIERIRASAAVNRRNLWTI